MPRPTPVPSARYATIDLDRALRRRAELDQLIEPLLRERDDLDSVLRLAEGCAYEWSDAVASCVAPPRDRKVRAFSHRTMVRMVLEDASGSLGVREIIDAIQSRFGETIERTSISPLLRKLARRGEVTHDPAARKWSHASGGEGMAADSDED